MPAKNTVARPRTAKPATGPPKQRLCRRVLSRPVSLRRHIWPSFYRFPLLSRFHTMPLLPPHLMQLGPVLTFLGPYRSHPSSSLTRRLASTSAASAAACTISRRCRRRRTPVPRANGPRLPSWTRAPHQPRQVADYVPGDVLRVLWPHLAHVYYGIKASATQP